MADIATLDFAWQHRNDDAAKLAMQRHDGIDSKLAAQQVEGWQTARTKWPSLAEVPHYMYPPRLNREQSSSEATARYKATLAGAIGHGADLTGGMGVDSLFLSRQAERFDYVERDEALAALARDNFATLGQENVTVHSGDSMEWIARQERLDLIFIDPARRDGQGRKVVAFEDCQPPLREHLGTLYSRCRRLMVKASPMIDIREACRQLERVREVHVVAVKGECKEVLFVCGEGEGECRVTAVDIRPDGAVAESFLPSEERMAEPKFADGIGRYLYEPNAALMKAGCHALLGNRYGLAKLDRNTHLYTSDTMAEGFPGRVFEVAGTTNLSTKHLRASIPEMKAHVVVRNYPVDAATLQRQLKIKEGGDVFIIATTIAGKKTGLVARLVSHRQNQ